MPRRKRGQILDARDASIVSQLASDGRLPNVAIAQAVGLSETAVRRRLERLLRSKVLHVGAHMDPGTMGYSVQVVLELQVHPGRAEEIGERLARSDRIEYAAVSLGQYDLVVGACFRSHGEMMDFIANQVQTIPGIRSCRVFPLSAVLKRHFQWNPLAQEPSAPQVKVKAPRRRPQPVVQPAKGPKAKAATASRPRRRRGAP